MDRGWFIVILIGGEHKSWRYLIDGIIEIDNI